MGQISLPALAINSKGELNKKVRVLLGTQSHRRGGKKEENSESLNIIITYLF